jgi:hypothetical protein
MDTAKLDTFLLRYDTGPDGRPYLWKGSETLFPEMTAAGPTLTPTIVDRSWACLVTLRKNYSAIVWNQQLEDQMTAVGLRALGLITEVMKSDRTGGASVATYLAQGLENREPTGKRAMATYLFSAKGVPTRGAANALSSHFTSDHPVMQICCALLLAQDDTQAPRQQRDAARERIGVFMQQERLLASLYHGKAEGEQLQYYCAALTRYLPRKMAIELASV